MFAIGGLVCAGGFVLLALLVGAALLRVAVTATNKLVGPGKAAPGGVSEWDWDDWDDEFETPVHTTRGASAIPEPAIGTGMMILFATAFVAGLAFVLLGFAAEGFLGLRMRREETKLAVVVFELPIVYLALTLLLVALLPTTFWRAAMVSFVYTFVLAAFAVVVGGSVYVFLQLMF